MKLFTLTVATVLVLTLATKADAASSRNILMVVTSHDRIDENHPTGLWLDEFAAPYEIFVGNGHRVSVASPKGGPTPVDPRSLTEQDSFAPATLAALEKTTPLHTVDLNEFDAVFFPGGHGTMYDLPSDKAVIAAVNHFLSVDQPAAFVCHGPAALVGATRADGSPAVAGRRVTGFTNDEEKAVELDGLMPFLLESRLREQGGEFVGASNFAEHVVVDGRLVTGQNPASSIAAARALLDLMD